MPFNFPTYTGGQPSELTIPQNVVTPNNPTDQEYFEAIKYTSDVIKRYRNSDATASDVALASDFMFQVGNARLSALQPGTLQGAPVWADQLSQNINRLQQTVNQLQQNMNNLEVNVARSYNASCGDGISRPWMIVNKNGIDPTTQNLPALRSRNNITTLSDNIIDAYITFYQINIQVNTTINQKKTKIAKHIGASFVSRPF